MNALDLLCALVAVAALWGGWRLGLIRRITGWIGLAAGLLVGLKILSRVEDLGQSAGTREFLIAIGIVLGFSALGHGIGAAIGYRLRREVDSPRLVVLDSASGAVIGLLSVIVLVWVMVPTMVEVPGWPAEVARSSHVATWVHAHLGDPPGPLRALGDSLGLARIPQVFEKPTPAPDLGPPPSTVPLGDPVLRTVEQSTVKVVAAGCADRLQSGSGWVASDGVVVTNAHVVAGGTVITVRAPGDDERRATLVGFDAGRDVAVLRVEALTRPGLATSTAVVGATGAVLGHPEGGPLTVSAARVDQRITAVGRDIYGAAAVRRSVLVLGSSLQRGDSGGALVDRSGSVMGMAFAIAPDRPGVAYALDMSEVLPVIDAAQHTRAVASGGCIG